jgi:neutral trehalase
MMEKYDVVDTSKAAGGGEYPSQDGFWLDQWRLPGIDP